MQGRVPGRPGGGFRELGGGWSAVRPDMAPPGADAGGGTDRALGLGSQGAEGVGSPGGTEPQPARPRSALTMDRVTWGGGQEQWCQAGRRPGPQEQAVHLQAQHPHTPACTPGGDTPKSGQPTLICNRRTPQARNPPGIPVSAGTAGSGKHWWSPQGPRGHVTSTPPPLAAKARRIISPELGSRLILHWGYSIKGLFR